MKSLFKKEMQDKVNGVVNLEDFVLAVWKYDYRTDGHFDDACKALDSKEETLKPLRTAVYHCMLERQSYLPIADLLRAAHQIIYEGQKRPKPNDGYYLNLAIVGSKTMQTNMDGGRTNLRPDLALVITDVEKDMMDLYEQGKERTGWKIVALPFEVQPAPKRDGKIPESRGRMKTSKG